METRTSSGETVSGVEGERQVVVLVPRSTDSASRPWSPVVTRAALGGPGAKTPSAAKPSTLTFCSRNSAVSRPLTQDWTRTGRPLRWSTLTESRRSAASEPPAPAVAATPLCPGARSITGQVTIHTGRPSNTPVAAEPPAPARAIRATEPKSCQPTPLVTGSEKSARLLPPSGSPGGTPTACSSVSMRTDGPAPNEADQTRDTPVAAS